MRVWGPKTVVTKKDTAFFLIVMGVVNVNAAAAENIGIGIG
jgi:hypothetical protein